MTASAQLPPAGPAPSLRRGGVLRSLWAITASHRRAFLGGLALKAVHSLLVSIPVVLLVRVIDDVRNDDLTTATIGIVTAISAVCLVAQVVVNYAAQRLNWISTFHLFGDLRLRLLDHLRRVPLGYHSERSVGNTLTTMQQDVTMLETFAHQPFPMMIGALTSPLVIIASLAVIDPAMAVATMVSVVAAGPVFWWSNRRFRALAQVRQDRQARATERIVEYVDGITVVRAFNQAGERQARFAEALGAFRRTNTRLAVQLLPLSMTTMAVLLLGIPVVMWAAGYRALDGVLDGGTAIVFLVLCLRVYQPLVQAAEQFELLQIVSASLDRVTAIIETPPQASPARPAPTPTDHSITFTDVHFAYDDRDEVLGGVSFHAPAGATTAIVGPSGGGKTTIMRLIAGFWTPVQGTISIGGTATTDLDPAQMYDLVTIVFQDPFLFQGTIRHNITFGRDDVDEHDMLDAARAARVDSFVSKLPDGYDTPVGEGGVTLSGGERQRITIARAILKDSPIVLFDEATASLDPTNERLLQQAVGELVRGKTLVVVAHRLSTIRSADQIVCLDHGRIVQAGTHEALQGDPDGLYARYLSERHLAESWRIR